MFFLALSCFFDDPVGVGNLISCSSAFSKTNLNIWIPWMMVTETVTLRGSNHLQEAVLGSFKSNTLATSCEVLTHWKRLWSWEGLGAGGEGDDRGWDGWMASSTQRTWVWVNSRSWWWTGRPGVLQSKGSQRVRHNWATELNWIEPLEIYYCAFSDF